jgi:hypothetical protein
MRLTLLACIAACSSAPKPTPQTGGGDTTPPTPVTAEDPKTAWNADPDNDRILGACDLCPDEPERKNEVADEDGCPETIEEIDGHGADPRIHYTRPLVTIQYDGDRPVSSLAGPWVLDEEIEAIACIGSSSDEARAKDRAAQLCASIEKSMGKRKLDIARYAQVDQDERVYLQVMRAAKVELFRWGNNKLERVAVAPVIGKPIAPGCSVAVFDEETHEQCAPSCNVRARTSAWIGHWPDDAHPIYPGK